MAPPSDDLKLLGSWASSYTHRVQLALKLKGLAFEYAEEDLADKSPSLLLHNPVYKKVPVLLHRGRPVLESVIILHYLDETWPDVPLVPADPYDRALARFWCHFVDDKLGPAVGAVFASPSEGQAAAVEQVHENLRLVERELREGAFAGRRFFGGDKIGVLDIVLGCGSYWLAVFEDVMEVKLVDPEAFPLFHSWLRDFEEQEEVKAIIPAIDRLLEYARGVRQMMLGLSPQQQ
ncbi:glutathione s-transferase [Musa troglodytarum]|uniref:Glutathione S-transferase n=1 Tax=Musa troglodytarum TaxID=320322 RepID=A0A9E7LDG7_9LILI|nr:glutathione s-transferase [Musa troglodytarum]